MNTPQQFAAAEPFPHVVFEDFLPPAVLAEAAASFDDVPAEAWVNYSSDDDHGKRTCNRLDAMPPAAANLLRYLSSDHAARVVGAMTGLDDLHGDETLYGGGLHETASGGFLGLHADNEVHPTTGMLRRLNLIIYCQPEWQPEWGGDLQLWSRDASRCVQRIEPRFNRAVLFATSPGNWHGHPAPLGCPQDVRRRSIAVFFWSPAVKRARFISPADAPFDASREAARMTRAKG